MRQISVDVAVIGGGPAGLAAAIAADRAGASVVLCEREARLGGILKQCIHDGFGLVRFGEQLSGPEYAGRFLDQLDQTKIEILTLAFVTRAARADGGYTLTLVTRDGLCTVQARALVLATGCRERTAKQVAIHGTRPSGVLTAGTAQHYVNLLGVLPTKKCVILGSGDIGLIMARRLTLEGAAVLGVYEAKPEPSGLARNIAQCLDDFDIPLHTGKTVTRVFGADRLEAVEISDVDGNMRPIADTQTRVDCDGLILSVGLIPENELALALGLPLDPRTKGPACDQTYRTALPGLFCCGNALHVNDLVDYVSESGERAGAGAAAWAANPPAAAAQPDGGIEVTAAGNLAYVVPQRIDPAQPLDEVVFFFRVRHSAGRSVVRVWCGETELTHKTLQVVRPPEMERLALDLSGASLDTGQPLRFSVETAGGDRA